MIPGLRLAIEETHGTLSGVELVHPGPVLLALSFITSKKKMSTNPYWTPPVEFKTRKHLKPIARDLGFQWTLPWPQPSSAGYYFGQNPVWGRRQDVYSSLPEWFATDNIVPSTAGVPIMNPYTAEMKFSREKFTRKH